jgi:hypothetical protein
LPPERLQCKGHVYEVMSDPVRADLPGGPERWVQVTKCLVCGDLTDAIDTTRWAPAGAMEMASCIATVEAEVARLQTVVATLKGERRWHNFV